MPVALIFGAGAGGDGGGDYKVRAIFDNASFLIPGQDVKVAGAKVGVVEDLDVTGTATAQGGDRHADRRATASRTSARTPTARSGSSR